MSTPLIRLQPHHIDYADGVGLVRRGKAMMRQGKHTNNWRPNFETALWKNRQSARCELAGKLWLNPISWNTIDEKGMGLADLSDFIDVKGVEKANHRLLVQLYANINYAYLLVDSSKHPDYEIVGWLWGSEAKLHPIETPDGQDRPCHCVPRSIPPMRDPQELFEEVRRRDDPEWF